jgi:phosphoglycolate phosphatase-like HAD superfamily hydrolase
MNKIIVFDYTGTLMKAKLVEEANKFRAKVLKRSLPTKKEHAHPEKLYKINNQFVEKLTGLTKNMKVKYRKNDLEYMEIKGSIYQNQISTNLFQIGMYMVAKKYKKRLFQDGFITQLKKLKNKDYKLAIVSGVRTDIISGMLQIAKIPVKFDYIFAQPPILGISNKINLKNLKKYGKVEYVLGDKLSDLKAGKQLGAKTIYVKWGHPAGGEEKKADYIISKPEELLKIIK